jgi:simple sugar transport system permease protein
MNLVWDLLSATLRNATPLVYGTVGETMVERAGILDLGIEGTMYVGAFAGFAAAFLTGSLWLGLLVAVLAGVLAGAVMGLLTVTLGANQHVSGLGLTIVLIGLSETGYRLLVNGSTAPRITPFGQLNPLGFLGDAGGVAEQYGLTYLGFLVVAPAVWWILGRTRFGLALRAVGENPEAADGAGVSVARVRYAALMTGSGLMALGGSFLTLCVLGSYTPDIIAGRGWVCLALVIFGRWRIWRGVFGALIFAFVYSLGLRLQILSGFGGIPQEVMLALPYLAVIAALALSGRNVAYPGAYLKPYRRT